MRCRECGSRQESGHDFCTGCGAKLLDLLDGVGRPEGLVATPAEVADAPDIPEAAEPAPAWAPEDEDEDELSADDELVAAAERVKAMEEMAEAAERKLQEARAREIEPVEVEVFEAPDSAGEPVDVQAQVAEQHRLLRETVYPPTPHVQTPDEYFDGVETPYEEELSEDRWTRDYSGASVVETGTPEEEKEKEADSIELGRTCGCGCAVIAAIIFALAAISAIIGVTK